MVEFSVGNQDLDGLVALEPAPPLAGQRLALAAVRDFDARAIGVHTENAQPHDGVRGAASSVRLS